MPKRKIVLVISILIIFMVISTFIIIKIKNQKKSNQNSETITPDTTAPIIVLGDSYTVKTGYLRL